MAREHYRCPLCGKLSLPGNFNIEDGEHRPSGEGGHALEVVTQHFVGRGNGGFSWEPEPASDEVLHALWKATRAAYLRVSAELGIDPWAGDDE